MRKEKEEENKAIVVRWFMSFRGKMVDLKIIDELAAPNMLPQYSLHAPRHGHNGIQAFMTDFRRAFPDLNFWGAADLIAEEDYALGLWEGQNTHRPGVQRFPGRFSAGRKMRRFG